MNGDHPGFLRVLGRRDVFAVAVGAMIGWGWIIMSGTWILRAGSAGAALAFAATGAAILVVALLYAELTAALPMAGGEHVWSLRALGWPGSFACTWAIVFGYVGICCFEAVALATVFDYIAVDVHWLRLWSLAGYDVHLGWALVGVAGAVLITIVNVIGVKPSALLQFLVTLVILVAGLVLAGGAAVAGSAANLAPLFAGGGAGFLGVMALAPFFFVGFDVIPQAAEEIALPRRQLGALIVVAVSVAILWYAMVIVAVAALAGPETLHAARLASADAAALAWGPAGSALLVGGGIAGIVTSWNAFVIGGSRALWAMADSGMLPAALGRLHPRYRTPWVAIVLIGIAAALAPFFGRPILVWIVDASSFGMIVAYLLVCVSFVILRRRAPDLPRPLLLPHGSVFGWLGILCCLGIGLVYLPWSPAALTREEWSGVLLWCLLGACLYALAPGRRRPKDQPGGRKQR